MNRNWTTPYILEVVTAAVGNVVEVSELREHLRFDGTDEESLLALCIETATDEIQRETYKQLLTATFDLKLFDFSCDRITIPVTPVSSITSITYVDANGASQTWSSSLYELQAGTESVKGYVKPIYAEPWPTVRGNDRDVTVRFVAGFGAKSDVPERLRTLIKMRAADLFYSRTATDCGKGTSESLAFRALMSSNTRQEFI